MIQTVLKLDIHSFHELTFFSEIQIFQKKLKK